MQPGASSAATAVVCAGAVTAATASAAALEAAEAAALAVAVISYTRVTIAELHPDNTVDEMDRYAINKNGTVHPTALQLQTGTTACYCLTSACMHLTLFNFFAARSSSAT
jgi:hypothetical protein